MESLLQLIAGHNADPVKIEAAIDDIIQKRLEQALSGINDVIDKRLAQAEAGGEVLLGKVDTMVDDKIARLELMIDSKINRLVKIRAVLSLEE